MSVEDSNENQAPRNRYGAIDANKQCTTSYKKLSLDIIIPIYKNAELTRICVDSILRHLVEISEYSPILILINDSPDDDDVESLLRAYQKHPSACIQIVTNVRNMGFVKTVNVGLRLSLNNGHDALLVNSDTQCFEGTLANLMSTADVDPQIGFVCPRSNNASICTLPHDSGGLIPTPAAARERWRRLADLMPAFHFVPTGVGFFMLVKHQIIANFGLLNEDFGIGYEEENDLVMRANKVGYRVVLANHSFAYHAGSASFNLLAGNLEMHRSENLKKVSQIHSEFLPLVHMYESSAHFRAERLLGKILPNSRGKIRLAIDLSNLGAYANGTSDFCGAVLKSISAEPSQVFDVVGICTNEAWLFHGFDRLQNVEHVEPQRAGRYAIAVRLGQPFDLHHLNVMENLAPINIFSMLDTIAEDCGQLAITHQHGQLWNHVAKYANGLIFISKFSEKTFLNRYPKAKNIPRYTKLLPTMLSSYPTRSVDGGRDYLLVVGNKFPHKDVERTAHILCTAMPTVNISVLGGKCGETGNIRWVESGNLSDQGMDHLFGRASVVIIPSHVEGFGFNVIHALASRKPLVLRDIDATREIIQTYRSISGVKVYRNDSELIDVVREAMALDSSSVDDHYAINWREWTREFKVFCEKRLEDSDLFDRLCERISDGDNLRRISSTENAISREKRAREIANVGKDEATESAAPAKRISVPQRPYSVGDVMKLESSEFVKAAYLLLLGRTVDAQGEAYYTSRLNGGVQKAQIIQELGCSVEASERGVDIKALMREVGAINGFYKSIFWRLSKGRGRGELQN